MEIDDRLGTLKGAPERGVLLERGRQFGRFRIRRPRFGPSLARRQRLQAARVALPTPIHHQPRIDALAPQHGADPAMFRRTVDLGQNAQFVRRREPAPPRAIRKFRRRCDGGRDQIGHNHPMVLQRPLR